MFECEPVSKFRFVLTGYTSKTFLDYLSIRTSGFL